MKKLLLATLLAAGGMIPMSAGEFSVLFENEPIENGSTVVFEGYSLDIQEYPGFDMKFYTWTVDPELYLVSDSADPMTIHAKSLNGVDFQLCAGGTCMRGTDITKPVEALKADTPLNLQLDWTKSVIDEPEIEIPAMEIAVEIYYTSNPSDVFSFTLKMGGFKAAGVDSVGADDVNVVLKGNALYYDLPSASQISVYSLSGKTVLNKTVSGNGSLSLDGLSKGVYLYRVSGKSNKSAKFIIK